MTSFTCSAAAWVAGYLMDQKHSSAQNARVMQQESACAREREREREKKKKKETRERKKKNRQAASGSKIQHTAQIEQSNQLPYLSLHSLSIDTAKDVSWVGLFVCKQHYVLQSFATAGFGLCSPKMSDVIHL